MTELRVGIAGFGVVGKRRQEVIDALPSLRVVAVCDQTISDDATAINGISQFKTYSRLLQEELDVLFVCMSNDIAAEVTIAGLKDGLHVFCEKPPGRNVEDIAQVVDVHRSCPEQRLKYGFNHRYHDSVTDALNIMRSGALGSVINLRGVYGKSQLITFDQTSWRTDRTLAGGGVLLDQGIHMVDLIRLFGGEFINVKSVISNSVWNYDVEDNAYALMQSDQGVVAMLHSSASQWRHRFNLEIGLTKGALTLSGILSGSKSYGAETLTVTHRGDDDMGDPREETTRYNHDMSWRLEVEEFADAILNKHDIKNGSVEDAFRTMQLVYQIYCADTRWRDAWDLTAIPSNSSK
jgi:predicted dehydrogenase